MTFVSVALTSVALLSVMAETRKPLNASPARTVLPLMMAEECPGLKKMACNLSGGAETAATGAGVLAGAAGSAFATGAGAGTATAWTGGFVSGAGITGAGGLI